MQGTMLRVREGEERVREVYGWIGAAVPALIFASAGGGEGQR